MKAFSSLTYFIKACALGLLFLSANSFAQELISFDKLDKSDGLSNNSITDIIQDPRGYIWLATSNGLNKYDGNEFTAYKTANYSSLRSNVIRCLETDHQGNLLVGTIGGGLYKLDQNNDSFIPIAKHISEIHDILKGTANKIWVGARDGLFCLEFKNSAYTTTKYSSLDVQSIEETDQGVWMATSKGVYLVNKSSKNTYPIAEKTLKDEFVFDLEFVGKNEIWIATRHKGLLIYNLKTETITPFSQIVSNAAGVKGCDISDIRKIHKSDSKIYIATDGCGLLIFDIDNRFVTKYQKTVNSLSISGNTLYSIFEDRAHNIWLGHSRTGISIIDNNSDNFQLYYNAGFPDDYSSTLCLYQDKNDIVFGTSEGGVHSLSGKNTANYNVNAPNVQVIYRDSKNNLWTGTFSQGVIVKDAGNNYLNVKIQGNDIRNIIEDTHGTVWIATYGNGIFSYNLSTGSTKNYTYKPDAKNGLSNNNAIDMVLKNQKLYIATFGGGLNILDTKTGFVKQLLAGSKGQTILDDNLKSIAVDDKGVVWALGTKGLNSITTKNNNDLVSKSYPFEKLGFTRNANAVLMDMEGYAWLSTDAGIYRFNPANAAFKKLNLGFQLNNTEFHLNSAIRTNNNKLLFGSVNGIVMFNPVMVFRQEQQPPLEITRFKVVNTKDKKQYLSDATYLNKIHTNETIVLKSEQNLFTIEFSSLQYPSAQEIKYQIKLNGFDKEWRDVGTARQATYTNLPDGEYSFHVRATNLREEWKAGQTAFSIKVLPPLWKTWWAIIIYVLLFIASLLAYRKYSSNWLKMKNHLKLEKIKREKEEEIHNLKITFFTNISHDLRTPLTLIHGTIRRILNKKTLDTDTTQSLVILKKNTDKLLRLSDELLDLRRIETGKMELKVTKNNILKFIKGAYESFAELALDRDIQYSFDVKGKPSSLWFDKYQMEKVFFNILSNAFKFTPNNGTISLVLQEQEDTISAEIRNSGTLLTREQIDKVFDRFYQSEGVVKDNTIGPGLGVGLSIVNDIIRLHAGEISVSSDELTGTCFKVMLQKGKEHFKQSQITEPEALKPEDLEDKEVATVKVITAVPERESVLIVEDDVDLQEFLKSSLQQKYHVYLAENGKTGYELAIAHCPDIIISDVMMPEMDGIEMCSLVKNNVKTSHIPIILLTARTSSSHKKLGLETGADDYLSKPFNEDELHIRIKNLVENRQKLRKKYTLEATTRPEEFIINSPDEIFLNNLKELIENNILNADLNTEFIAREMNMSHSLVYKKLKAVTGMSIVEFVRDYRLRKAEMLLVQNKLSISEVCYKAGFNDRNYFSVWFKKKYKMSPKEYTKSKLEQ